MDRYRIVIITIIIITVTITITIIITITRIIKVVVTNGWSNATHTRRIMAVIARDISNTSIHHDTILPINVYGGRLRRNGIAVTAVIHIRAIGTESVEIPSRNYGINIPTISTPSYHHHPSSYCPCQCNGVVTC